MTTNEILNQKTKERYSLYAQFYPVLALLAYYVIWRGNIFKHIQFFKNILSSPGDVLDIATGDGSLTAAALKPGKNPNLQKLVCLDISSDMLEKAKKNLKSEACQFVLGDVGNMPFNDGEFSVISCFGGLNSFPDVPLALKEMYRVLSNNGRIRGSALLLPKAQWRQKKIKQWIQEGYQTQSIVTDQLFTWFSDARFKIIQQQQIGDVLLFEIAKKS